MRIRKLPIILFALCIVSLVYLKSQIDTSDNACIPFKTTWILFNYKAKDHTQEMLDKIIAKDLIVDLDASSIKPVQKQKDLLEDKKKPTIKDTSGLETNEQGLN